MADLLGASPAVFLLLVVVLTGFAAVLAGRAVATGWKPAWHTIPIGLGLALAARFLAFALFEAPLLSVTGYAAAAVVLVALGRLSWQEAHVSTVVRQYPWRFERSSPLAYRAKATEAEGA